MLPNLIGLYSSAPRCGKTEMSEALQKGYGYVNVKFAQCLKGMISILLVNAGFSIDESRAFIEGDRKEEVIPGFGVSTRFMMQTLGTDWGRNIINTNIWVLIAMNRIQKLIAQGHRVVVDDMRFHNEYEAMLEAGAKMVHVERPGCLPSNDHPSEGILDSRGFNLRIVNDGTIYEFRQKILDGLKSL